MDERLHNKLLISTLHLGTYISLDSGTTWKSVNNSLPWEPGDSTLPDRKSYYQVQSFAQCKNRIFAGTFYELYYSNDTGMNWIKIPTGLPDSAKFVSLASYGNLVFAGTKNCGILQSVDGGTNWTHFELPYKNEQINTLTAGNGYLFVGTDADAVWRKPLPEEIPESVYSPRQITCQKMSFNIYIPTHRNPNFLITISLPHQEMVTVTMYNLSGKKVATLLNRKFDSGIHTVLCDRGNISAGSYLVRLNAGQNAFVKNIHIF